jgi:hypothetical protein
LNYRPSVSRFTAVMTAPAKKSRLPPNQSRCQSARGNSGWRGAGANHFGSGNF